jgi:hypothetical protein
MDVTQERAFLRGEVVGYTQPTFTLEVRGSNPVGLVAFCFFFVGLGFWATRSALLRWRSAVRIRVVAPSVVSFWHLLAPALYTLPRRFRWLMLVPFVFA